MAEKFKGKAEEEVWQTLRALNDAWTKGDPADLHHYFHEHMVAFAGNARERIEGRDACVKGWTAFANAAEIHAWREISPKIQIYGNTAVVTYYFDMSFNMGSEGIEMDGRDMFVFVKEDGKWLAVADQFSSYPQENT